MGQEVATETMGNESAEIFEFENVRARRTGEVDSNNFLAIGQYLEAVREKIGMPLQQISQKTHIKIEFLEAIEAMNIDVLPSKPFAIGFVRGFAEALDLDPGPIVERFKEEAGFASSDESKIEDAAAQITNDFEPTERPELPLLAVALILAFMIWCAYQVTRARDIVRPYDLSGVPQAETLGTGEAILDPGIAASLPINEFTPVDPVQEPIVVEAFILDRIEPIYPRNCIAGAGTLETVSAVFTVSPDGGVTNERVTSASNGCFERAALNALRRWRFSPRTIDGTPRPAYEQQITFKFDRP